MVLVARPASIFAPRAALARSWLECGKLAPGYTPTLLNDQEIAVRLAALLC